VAGDGEAVRAKLGVDVDGFWGSSGKDEGTKGVSVFGEAPGALGLARVARNRCGIERGEARVPQLENRQIPRLGGSIYRGFWLPS
jgi:hypothetical protein